MGALDRSAGRVRAKPWVAIAIVGGALLVAGWLGWAIYVASDRGLNKGIGVLVAWPALLLAAVLVCLPLVGIYLLIRPRESATADRVSATEERSPAEAEESQATETS
jgi:hypothetical protein